MIDLDTRTTGAGELAQRLADGAMMRAVGLERRDLPAFSAMAEDAMRRGDHALALRAFAAHVLLDPLDPAAQRGLALAALAAGHADAALHAASALIAMAPSAPEGYLLSARACIAMGRPAEAREDLADAQTFAREARDGDLYAEAETLLAGLA